MTGAERLGFFLDELPSGIREAMWASFAREQAERCVALRLGLPDPRPRPPRQSRSTSLRTTRRSRRPRPRSTGDDPLRAIEPREYVEILTGVEIGRGGMACCPLPGHEDRTPSFKAYDDPDRGFFCFGCHRGGDVYTFGGELWNVDRRRSFVELRRRLLAELLGESA